MEGGNKRGTQRKKKTSKYITKGIKNKLRIETVKRRGKTANYKECIERELQSQMKSGQKQKNMLQEKKKNCKKQCKQKEIQKKRKLTIEVFSG